MQRQSVIRRVYNRGLAISAILLAVVLLAAIAIAIAMSSRSTSANSSTQQAKLMATTVINQANNLKIGFDRMASNGQVQSKNITFDNSATTGLFDPTVGGTVQQYPPAQAFATATTYSWIYNNNIKLDNIGQDGNADYVAILPDLSQTVCQQVNQALYNTTSIKTTAAAAATLANFTVTTDPAIDMSSTGDTNGATNAHPEGCIGSVDATTHYIYYKSLQDN